MWVLLAYDGSAPADAALEYVRETLPVARVTVLGVVDPTYGVAGIEPTADEDEAVAAATDLVEDAAAAIEASGADVGTVVESGLPRETIVERAAALGVDGIVMGTHGRTGLERALLGSVAEAVARESTVPVTLVSGAAAED